MSAIAVPSAALARAWKHALCALALVWAALLLAGHATLDAMVGIWLHSNTFAHAFTVPPIALWLAWRRRACLAALTPRAAPWVLPLLMAAVLAWLLGMLAVVNALSQLALVASLVLAVPAVLGLQVARVLAFPLAFLFFCVPLGEFLMPLLMDWTADFTVFALRASGIPVMRDGLQFVIPSGYWSVEAACSGIRYLIASGMVGVLFAYLNYRNACRRALFVAASLVVPIVANWVRAYLIVTLGHLSNNTIATGVDHLVYGWVFFGIVIVLLFAIGLRWAEPELEQPAQRVAPGAVLAQPTTQGKIWVVAAAVLAVTLAGQGWLTHLQTINNRGDVPQLQSLLAPAPGWQATNTAWTGWQHGFVNPAAQFQSGYARGTQQAGLVVAYYAGQHDNSKLVSSENRLAPAPADGPRWVQGSTGRRELLLDGIAVPVRSTPLRALFTPGSAPTDGIIAWQFYWVNGTLTSSDVWAKALSAWSQLLGRGDDGAAVLIYAPLQGTADANTVLQDFARDHLGALLLHLQQARDKRQSTINENRP